MTHRAVEEYQHKKKYSIMMILVLATIDTALCSFSIFAPCSSFCSWSLLYLVFCSRALAFPLRQENSSSIRRVRKGDASGFLTEIVG